MWVSLHGGEWSHTIVTRTCRGEKHRRRWRVRFLSEMSHWTMTGQISWWHVTSSIWRFALPQKKCGSHISIQHIGYARTQMQHHTLLLSRNFAFKYFNVPLSSTTHDRISSYLHGEDACPPLFDGWSKKTLSSTTRLVMIVSSFMIVSTCLFMMISASTQRTFVYLHILSLFICCMRPCMTHHRIHSTPPFPVASHSPTQTSNKKFLPFTQRRFVRAKQG
jgi:hypothetical protein